MATPSPPLRIALVAPLVSPIADPFLGGSQALLYDLATGLAQRGHAVALFAAEGSLVPGVEVVRLGIDAARLRPTLFGAPESTDPAITQRERAYFLRIADEIRRRGAAIDVVHNHAFDVSPFELMSLAHRRVIHTLHLPPVVSAVVAAARHAAERGALLVSVSRWAAASWRPQVGATRLIRNGVPLDRIAVGTAPRNGWLFVGRVAPEKGLDHALAAAERAGRKLCVIGGVYDASYYERVRPRFRGHEVVGVLPRESVFARMAQAEGLLMPVSWDEPFGLSAAEAMAAGTPVAAYARGALPELIDDGHTGFLVSAGDIAGLAEAAQRFRAIDPSMCRRRVEEHFAGPRMVEEYLRLYEQVLAPA